MLYHAKHSSVCEGRCPGAICCALVSYAACGSWSSGAFAGPACHGPSEALGSPLSKMQPLICRYWPRHCSAAPSKVSSLGSSVCETVLQAGQGLLNCAPRAGVSLQNSCVRESGILVCSEDLSLGRPL